MPAAGEALRPADPDRDSATNVSPSQTGRVIGEVLLKWAAERQGELGFALARDVHGQGYAAEAATAVLDLAFDGLGFHRVSAVVIEGNDASARLLPNFGACLLVVCGSI